MNPTRRSTDRRHSPRYVVNKRAQIGGEECVVEQMSASGARISIPAEMPVPYRCHLLLLGEGLTMPFRIVWRSSTEIGVAWDGEPRQAGAVKEKRLPR